MTLAEFLTAERESRHWSEARLVDKVYGTHAGKYPKNPRGISQNYQDLFDGVRGLKDAVEYRKYAKKGIVIPLDLLAPELAAQIVDEANFEDRRAEEWDRRFVSKSTAQKIKTPCGQEFAPGTRCNGARHSADPRCEECEFGAWARSQTPVVHATGNTHAATYGQLPASAQEAR